MQTHTLGHVTLGKSLIFLYSNKTSVLGEICYASKYDFLEPLKRILDFIFSNVYL